MNFIFNANALPESFFLYHFLKGKGGVDYWHYLFVVFDGLLDYIEYVWDKEMGYSSQYIAHSTGQVASNDMMKIDQIPGGHLILPSVDCPGRGTPSPRLVQQLSRMDSNTFYIGKDKPTQPIPGGYR